MYFSMTFFISSPFYFNTMLKHKTYSFEKLDVWKESRKLALEIYLLTNKFPSEEKFGLVSQMRRCCISISSNLAEGTSRISFADQARLTEISFGSTMELLNHLILSFDLQFLIEEKLNQIRLSIDSIANKLNALRNSQLVRYGNMKRRDSTNKRINK